MTKKRHFLAKINTERKSNFHGITSDVNIGEKLKLNKMLNKLYIQGNHLMTALWIWMNFFACSFSLLSVRKFEGLNLWLDLDTVITEILSNFKNSDNFSKALEWNQFLGRSRTKSQKVRIHSFVKKYWFKVFDLLDKLWSYQITIPNALNCQ